MKNKNCVHENNIEYMDLLQIDGEPFYIVKCDCGDYGLIKLVESTNEFGLSEQNIKNLIKDNKYESYLYKNL